MLIRSSLRFHQGIPKEAHEQKESPPHLTRLPNDIVSSPSLTDLVMLRSLSVRDRVVFKSLLLQLDFNLCKPLADEFALVGSMKWNLVSGNARWNVSDSKKAASFATTDINLDVLITKHGDFQ